MPATMKLIPASLKGVFVIQPAVFEDQRGQFVKTYHAGIFEASGIAFTPREEFFSVSRKNVVRGMHFQNPPFQEAKLVLTDKLIQQDLKARKGAH